MKSQSITFSNKNAFSFLFFLFKDSTGKIRKSHFGQTQHACKGLFWTFYLLMMLLICNSQDLIKSILFGLNSQCLPFSPVPWGTGQCKAVHRSLCHDNMSQSNCREMPWKGGGVLCSHTSDSSTRWGQTASANKVHPNYSGMLRLTHGAINLRRRARDTWLPELDAWG